MKFRTDGIRGRYGGEITTAVAYALGQAVVRILGPWVALARDTRPSGPPLVEALTGGVVDAGGFAVDWGVLPTPALSRGLSARDAYHAGIMVTASHNPAQDNGLKVLDGRGCKLDGATRTAIEAVWGQPSSKPDGQARPDHTTGELYRQAFSTRWPHGLVGRTLVLDCGNGAAGGLAESVLEAMGARVRRVDPGDGAHINDRCGALFPSAVAAAMGDADLGISLDGDGDRVALVTPAGRILDGDALLWLLAEPPVVVGTVMSNLGLERGLASRGIRLERTNVGDSEVADGMRRTQARVGGEPSGHILFADGNPTADGLEAAVRVLVGGPIEPRLQGYSPTTPIHRTVPRPGEFDLRPLLAVIETLKAEGARVVVRRSGTEPVVRIMVEHPDVATAEVGADTLAALLLADFS